mmetsp:Transcript_16713/g.28213  ORF Transcript_16713/g.28213 Transcript_16713/m.28213 type:complete len:294 (+) Transcript_16713:1088-1969(+)
MFPPARQRSKRLTVGLRRCPTAEVAADVRSVRFSRNSRYVVLESQYARLCWSSVWFSMARLIAWMMRSKMLVRSASKDLQCSSARKIIVAATGLLSTNPISSVMQLSILSCSPCCFSKINLCFFASNSACSLSRSASFVLSTPFWRGASLFITRSYRGFSAPLLVESTVALCRVAAIELPATACRLAFSTSRRLISICRSPNCAVNDSNCTSSSLDLVSAVNSFSMASATSCWASSTSTNLLADAAFAFSSAMTTFSVAAVRSTESFLERAFSCSWFCLERCFSAFLRAVSSC